MKRFSLLLVPLLLVSCETDPSLIHIENLNNNTISVFGHGGMGIQFKHPINSWESIEHCLCIGADGSEIDVQLTRDSVPVAFHHLDLNDGTHCDGVVSEKYWSEIKDCKYNSIRSSKIRVRSLDDLFSRIGSPGSRIFTFDCKLYSDGPGQDAFRSRFANAIIKVINDHHIENNVFIESRDTSFLRLIMEREPGLKLFIYRPFEEALPMAEHMNLFGITIANEEITKEQVELAHSKGIRITLFGMDSDRENFEAIEKNPDFTQSDRLAHLLKIFKKLEK